MPGPTVVQGAPPTTLRASSAPWILAR
uniref:Uncharacterized protein n=1 Tax=Arundo donax TaxID=35708 RepID=A0A0A9B8V9_ARUDO